MKLKFSKMHGLGNDFMVIDAINQSFSPEPEVIRGWANRFDGIGFDQMLIVESTESHQAAFKYRIFNADGGEVSQCGNGARCFARFVREQKMTDLDIIPVETNAGLLHLQMIDETRVLVNMGVPLFEPELIPLATETRQNLYSLSGGGAELRHPAHAAGHPLHLHAHRGPPRAHAGRGGRRGRRRNRCWPGRRATGCLSGSAALTGPRLGAYTPRLLGR